MSARLPSATSAPSTLPTTPLPVTERKSPVVPSAIPRSSAAATMAAASGCSLAALQRGREPQELGLGHDRPRARSR